MEQRTRVEVKLTGGPPWGFRLTGMFPFTVHKVRRKSKAYRRLREGDRIVCVNGRPCDGLTYDQLMDVADGGGPQLDLHILRRECDKEKRVMEEDKMSSTNVPETSSETIEENQGDSFTLEDGPKPAAVEPFPAFEELQSELSASSRQRGENNFTKITDEVESFPQGLPDITMDTIDLNNLIAETQKRLDSFRNNWSKGLDSNSTLLSEKNESPTNLHGPVEDPAFSLPDIGFTSQSSETSTVSTDIPFGTETTKKKKMFSSSSFYEEPHSMYPTLEEQVEMARKIADSLADDNNSKSKGANMFYKRLTRSNDWIHEGPEPSDESGPEVESRVPFRSAKGLKLVLDPRHPLDLAALRSSGYVISEHNAVSPEVCHGLVKDLQSPTGRGGALFAKRKKKSEEWVVDEERVKAMVRERKCQVLPPLDQDVKLVTMESPPFGFCSRIRPDQLAETVIKRAESLTSRVEGCVSPPSYDVYRAKPPRGWEGNAVSISPQVAASVPQQQSKNVHNGFQTSKKMVFQNFNAVPRLWKGTSVH